jgi:hypothetical protein
MKFAFAFLSILLPLSAALSVAAAPTPHAKSSTGKALTQVSAGDYLSVLGPTGSARWRPSHNPIKVWISPGEQVQGYNAEFLPVVKQAFEEWEQASAGKIKFAFVSESDHPDLSVRFSPKHIEIDCEGYTYVTPKSDGFIDDASITLITFDKEQRPESTEAMHCLALHEIGHALGLTGHSKGTKDIMRPHINVTTGQHYSLSEADRKTIARLYNADPFAATRPLALAKMGLRPAVQKHQILNNDAVYAMNHQQFPIAIEKLNQALELEPTYSYAKENLQVAYYNWALQEIQQGHYAKALNLAEQSVQWAKKQNNSSAEHVAMDIVFRAKWNQTYDDALISEARAYDPSIAKRMEDDKRYYEWQRAHPSGRTQGP